MPCCVCPQQAHKPQRRLLGTGCFEPTQATLHPRIDLRMSPDLFVRLSNLIATATLSQCWHCSATEVENESSLDRGVEVQKHAETSPCRRQRPRPAQGPMQATHHFGHQLCAVPRLTALSSAMLCPRSRHGVSTSPTAGCDLPPLSLICCG